MYARMLTEEAEYNLIGKTTTPMETRKVEVEGSFKAKSCLLMQENGQEEFS